MEWESATAQSAQRASPPVSGRQRRRASASEVLEGIRVPTAVLHAWDDPIVVPESIPRDVLEAASAVQFLDVPHGGHVGFVCEGNPTWLADPVLNWLEAHAS